MTTLKMLFEGIVSHELTIFGIIIVSYSQIRLEELRWQEIHQIV